MDYLKLFKESLQKEFEINQIIEGTRKKLERLVKEKVFDSYNNYKFTCIEDGISYTLFKIECVIYRHKENKIDINLIFLTDEKCLKGKKNQDLKLIKKNYENFDGYLPYQTNHKPSLIKRMEYTIDLEKALKGDFSLLIQ